MTIFDKTCSCEDFPCCGHGSRPLSQAEEKQMYEDNEERNLRECNGYQDLAQSTCKQIDCKHYKNCWSGE